MRVIIYPYKMGSQSASRLAEGLREAGVRCMKVYPDRRYNPRANDKIINWGNSTFPNWFEDLYYDYHMKNNPCIVGNASNKLSAFQIMQRAGVSIPEFTTDEAEAQQWYLDGHKVIGREKLTGHSGEGIRITDDLSYPQSEGGWDVIKMREVFGRVLPLYVKYIKKAAEYRVHVFNGQVIDIQQKRKRRDIGNEEVNYQVRSHSNGWVFCRDNIDTPHDSILSNSIEAVQALGLDFGAVDVIWNNHLQQAFVLEVNTAPGLEGSTVSKYINSIRGIL